MTIMITFATYVREAPAVSEVCIAGYVHGESLRGESPDREGEASDVCGAAMWKHWQGILRRQHGFDVAIDGRHHGVHHAVLR